MKSRIDMTGDRFERLKVVKFSHSVKYIFKNSSCTHSFWECVCDCGNTKVVKRCHLISGYIRSCGCLHRKDFGKASFNRVYKHYKNSAEKRNLEFRLDKDYFKYITSQNCHYCGISPNTIQKTTKCNGEYIYNGIDRVDNSRGYEPENCVPCCNMCNMAKRTNSVDEFIG